MFTIIRAVAAALMLLVSVDPGHAASSENPAEEVFSLPKSEQQLTQKQIDDPYHPADWFPDDHVPMPPIVRSGNQEKGLWACSLCHLASGYGHPESASLTGLSEEYLYQQLLAFKNWHRADWSGAMFLFVWKHEDQDLRDAARYFASVKPGPVVHVKEAASVPETYIDKGWRTKLKEPTDPKMEPIGQRIITLPDSEFLRTARHPYATFTSYVPVGSLERGKKIAVDGTETSQPCINCHGPDMRGTDLGPYLAGQFPDYLLRQLRAFKWGVRRQSGDEGGQMEEQVRFLSEDELLAVAAYVASLPRN